VAWQLIELMVVFTVPVLCPTWALAIVAGHGATDWVLGWRLLLYAGVLLPTPGWVVTPGFAVASLSHFAADVGWQLSLGLHVALLLLHLGARSGQAFLLLVAYMTLVHVPAHCVDVARGAHGGAALLGAGLLTTCLAARPPWGDGEFAIDHTVQKLVICHILCHLD